MAIEDMKTLIESINHAWQLSLRLYARALDGQNHAAAGEALKQMVELIKLRKSHDEG